MWHLGPSGLSQSPSSKMDDKWRTDLSQNSYNVSHIVWETITILLYHSLKKSRKEMASIAEKVQK